MSVKRNAKKFFKKINRNLDFLTVKQYYERNGWKIFYFSETDSTIEELGLEEKAKNEKGFIYNEDNLKYIFININLSEREKRDTIFHEAGHIELEHKYSDLNNDAIERQANEFANILINMCGDDNHSKKTIIVLSCIIALMFIINLLLVLFYFDDTSKIQTSTPVSNDITVETEHQYVYVTPSGNKYHLQNCYYIRNNEQAHSIDIKSAEKSYLPCSICIIK